MIPKTAAQINAPQCGEVYVIPEIDAPSVGNPDMEAELNVVVAEQANVVGLDMQPTEVKDTCQALDNLAPWEVRRYVETLATLLKHASPGPWRLGLSCGAVVNDEVTVCPPDVVRAYGGNCIFESAKLADRELLVFMRNIAPSILRDIHYCERVDKINDGLLKACGQLYAENKQLKAALEARS